MSLLDIVHPAAKTLVDIAQAQDAEIGDGTTTVVLLAGELLKASKAFIEDGVHPQIIIRVRKTHVCPFSFGGCLRCDGCPHARLAAFTSVP
jgi:chaperonin GroEL (HSP60 family)